MNTDIEEGKGGPNNGEEGDPSIQKPVEICKPDSSGQRLCNDDKCPKMRAVFSREIVHMPRSTFRRTAGIMILVLLIGVFACSIIICLGMRGAKKEQLSRFEKQANRLLNQLEQAFEEYSLAGRSL